MNRTITTRFLMFLVASAACASSAQAQSLVHHVNVWWTQSGTRHETLNLPPGSSATINRDSGTPIDIQVFRVSDAPVSVEFFYSDIHNGNTVSRPSSEISTTFIDAVGAADTQVFIQVNTAAGRVELDVFNIPAGTADLVAANATVDGTVSPRTYHVGETASLSVAARNIGSRSASASRLGYYLGRAPGDTSPRFDEDAVPALISGAASLQSSSYTFQDADVGTKYFVFAADWRNAVAEGAAEGNNLLSVGPILVRPRENQPPSIRVVEPAVNRVISPGEPVAIQWVDEDPDSNAQIALARDTDSDPTNGGHTWIALTIPSTPDGTGDIFQWDTSNTPEGVYHLWAMITDLTNPPVYSVAPGTVTIRTARDDAPPAVSDWNVLVDLRQNALSVSVRAADSSGVAGVWLTYSFGTPAYDHGAPMTFEPLEGTWSTIVTNVPAFARVFLRVLTWDDSPAQNAAEIEYPGNPVRVGLDGFATVVVHGLELENETPAWTVAMANSIQQASGAPASTFNWTKQAGISKGGEGWAAAAGEQLYVRLAAADPDKLEQRHLIGHSLGSVVVSEAAKRLLFSGRSVRQVTYLDAVDYTPSFSWYGLPVFPSLVERFNPKVGAWMGVGHVDSYHGNGDVIGRRIDPLEREIRVPGLLEGSIVDGAHDVGPGTPGCALNDWTHNGDGDSIHDWYQRTIGFGVAAWCNNSYQGWYLSPAGPGVEADWQGEHPSTAIPPFPTLVNGDFECVGTGNEARVFAGWEWTEQVGGEWSEQEGYHWATLREVPGQPDDYAACLAHPGGFAFTNLAYLTREIFLPDSAEKVEFDYWVEASQSGESLVGQVQGPQGDPLGMEVDLGSADTARHRFQLDITPLRNEACRLTIGVGSRPFEDNGFFRSRVWVDNIEIVCGDRARITDPLAGSNLRSSDQTFTWSPGRGITEYTLQAGTTRGGSDILAPHATAELSEILTSLPGNGSPVFIRLWSRTEAGWLYEDVQYTSTQAPSRIRATYPDATSTARCGATTTLTWRSAGAAGPVRLLLLGGDGLHVEQVLSSSTLNTGRFTWTVPPDLPPAANYRVRVESIANPAIWGATEGYFTVAPPAGVSVQSPNGGETFGHGETVPISWITDGLTGSISIELWRGGRFAATIAASIQDSGTYAWTIPGGIAPGMDYQIKISSRPTNRTSDLSDGFFGIALRPRITVTAPNGGERWQRGSTQTIRWASQDIQGPVGIGLAFGGYYVMTISDSTPDTGSYRWTIPSSLVPGSEYRVRVWSVDNPEVGGGGDGPLTILQEPTIFVTAPANELSVGPRSTLSITWTTVNVSGDVKIQLFHGSRLDRTITSRTPNTGSFLWTIPATQNLGTDYRVKVISVAHSTDFGFSPGAFSITNGV